MIEWHLLSTVPGEREKRGLMVWLNKKQDRPETVGLKLGDGIEQVEEMTSVLVLMNRRGKKRNS